MVSEDSFPQKPITPPAKRRRAYCHVVFYVYAGVPLNAKAFWDFEKAERYEKKLRREMYHPDYDETAVFCLKLPRSDELNLA